jgi:hypothetical protein
MLHLSYYLLCFPLKKLENKRAKQTLFGSEGNWEAGRKWEGVGPGGEVDQAMYTHMIKYKNNK